MLRPALEVPEVGLDGHLPLVRPLPHVAVLQDELPHLFQDDHVGAEAEEEEEELRGEHTLEEKFGERWARPQGFGTSAPSGPAAAHPAVLGVRKGSHEGLAGPRRREAKLLGQFAQHARG